MLVGFTRRADNGTVAEFTRRDGVGLRLHSYDRTELVPHDAAHLVVERAFGLTQGLWGCLDDGALFDSVEILAGRTRHDHRARSAALRKERDAHLRLAEQVVGITLGELERADQHLTRALRAVWELYRVAPPPDLEAKGWTAVADLQVLRDRWARTRTGAALEATWPRGGAKGNSGRRR